MRTPTTTLLLIALAVAGCGGERSAARPAQSLNDTGTTFCRDAEGAAAVCAGAPAQDGNTGRDVQAPKKTGGGTGGLDLTKLDGDGRPLARQDLPWNPAGSPTTSEQWHCVRDNHTGLIWEVKSTTAGSLNHKDWAYQWRQDADNGGFVGEPSAESCGGTACETGAFTAALNQSRWCGITEWRLPTAGELLSLVVTDNLNLAFDTHYFPETQPSHYWTGQTYAPDNTKAWYVYLSDGSVATTMKNKPMYLRLVHKEADK